MWFLDVFDNEDVVPGCTKYVSTGTIGHLDTDDTHLLDHSGFRLPRVARLSPRITPSCTHSQMVTFDLFRQNHPNK